MLELKNVFYFRDNKQILDNISLKIDNSKLVAITGPNGSGKSTLAKIIMGILKPDSGSIFFDGKDITNVGITDRAKLGIGFAFQQPVKFKGLTVRDLIDPNVAPGVSVPAKNGINLDEAYALADEITKYSDIIKSADLVEYNPLFDKNNVTKEIATNILNKWIEKF